MVSIIERLKEKLSHTWLERIAEAGFLVLIVFVAFRPDTAQDYDFWWHLALGKWELLTKSFLLTDIFSYTFAGGQWFNNTQLFDVPLYLLYNSLGDTGLYLIRLVVYAFSYFLLYKTALLLTKAPKPLIIALFVPSLLMVRQFARPEITLPLFVAFYLWALYRYQRQNSKLLYSIPVVQALWVNVNGGYVIGLFIIAVFLASEILRDLVANRDNILRVLHNRRAIALCIVFIASAATIFINPYGVSIVKWLLFFFGPHNVTADTPPRIGEFLPVSLNQLLHLGYATPYKLLAILLGIALLYQIFKRLRASNGKFFELLNYEDFIIAVYFFFLSVQYHRFTSLFSFIAPLIILKNMHLHPAKNIHYFGIASVIAAFAFFTAFYPLSAISFAYPKESIEFIRSHNVRAPLFHTYEWGGYLTATLYPDYRVFIDGRTPNLYDTDFFWYYRHLNVPSVFDAVSKQYQFNAILIPPTDALARTLIDSKQWTLVFFDNESMLLLKDTEQNKELISRFQYPLLDPSRKAENYLGVCNQPKEKAILLDDISRNSNELEHPLFGATVLASLFIKCPDATDADYARALILLERALKAYPRNGELYYQRGALQLQLDQDEQALQSFKKSIQIQKNSFNMTGLGIALHNRGRFEEARKVFQKILFLPDGDNPPNEFYQVYGRVSYQLNNNQKAIELFHRYRGLVGLNKLTAQDYLDLSNAYRDAGDTVRAEEYFQKSKGSQTQP